MTKKEAYDMALRCLAILAGETAPPAKQSKPVGDALGAWQRAKIKAVAEKEANTKSGPKMRTSLKLGWVEQDESPEIWASTFNAELREEIAKYSKGDTVEVQLQKNGDFWNIMGIRSSKPRNQGMQESDIPF
jgi:hypothetical protein